MMRLVRISLALALALLIATPVMAQPPEGKGGGRGRGGAGGFGFGAGGRGISERLLGTLELTADQMDAAKKAIAKHAEKIKELTEKSRLSQEDRTKLMEAVRAIDREGKTPEEIAKLFQAEMKKVQTPEQAKAAEDLVKERAAELKDVKEAIGADGAKKLDEALKTRMGPGGGKGKDGAPGGKGTRKRKAKDATA